MDCLLTLHYIIYTHLLWVYLLYILTAVLIHDYLTTTVHLRK